MKTNPKRTLSRKKIFYVYALLDSRKTGTFRYGHWKFKFEPFYIGKGKGDRVDSHFKQSAVKSNSHKNNKIRKILSKKLFPEIVYISIGLTENQAFKLESNIINIIGRQQLNTGPLTNKTDGGEGATGRILKSKCRARISDSIKEYWRLLSDTDKIKYSEKQSKIMNLVIQNSSTRSRNIWNKNVKAAKNTKDHKKLVSINTINMYANFSDEQRVARGTKISESKKIACNTTELKNKMSQIVRERYLRSPKAKRLQATRKCLLKFVSL